MQRPHPLVIFPVRLSLVVQEQLDHRFGAIYGCEVQRSISLIVPGVNIRPVIEQELSNLQLSLAGRALEWSAASRNCVQQVRAVLRQVPVTLNLLGFFIQAALSLDLLQVLLKT